MSVAALLASGDPAVCLFTERDLLGRKVDARSLWTLKGATAILDKQQRDGSWLWKGSTPGHNTFGEDYTQIETFRRVGQLVELYGFDRRHPTIERAADYLFSCQTSEGDFRGIYGRQYTPNYTGAILELLVKAGYASDVRVRNSFEWLLYMRQEDGGWALPMRTHGETFRSAARTAPGNPEHSKPFSHLVTGMVLRAFAAHPKYRKSTAARTAGGLLIGRFFRRDTYPDRGATTFWERPSFPFWFTDVVSALDAVTTIGVPYDRITRALGWLQAHRGEDGVYRFKALKNRSVRNLDLWLTLAVSRVLKRIDQNSSVKPATGTIGITRSIVTKARFDDVFTASKLMNRKFS